MGEIWAPTSVFRSQYEFLLAEELRDEEEERLQEEREAAAAKARGEELAREQAAREALETQERLRMEAERLMRPADVSGEFGPEDPDLPAVLEGGGGGNVAERESKSPISVESFDLEHMDDESQEHARMTSTQGGLGKVWGAQTSEHVRDFMPVAAYEAMGISSSLSPSSSAAERYGISTSASSAETLADQWNKCSVRPPADSVPAGPSSPPPRSPAKSRSVGGTHLGARPPTSQATDSWSPLSPRWTDLTPSKILGSSKSEEALIVTSPDVVTAESATLEETPGLQEVVTWALVPLQAFNTGLANVLNTAKEHAGSLHKL